MGEQFCIIPTDLLDYSKKNPRKEFTSLTELAESIKEYGVLEPIIVKPVGDRFEVIVGERRAKAALIAGLKEIPVIIRNLTEQQADEIRLIENIHRADLTDSEKGDAIYSLLLGYPERYPSIQSIAEALKVSYGTVRVWCSKSLKLSPYIQQLVASNELTERAAQLLLKYDREIQDRLGNAIVQFDIRGGRDGIERKFIQLYDEDPTANLRELAEKAKSIQTVQVPIEELSKKARAEVEKIIEERKKRTKQLRKKAAKKVNKTSLNEALKQVHSRSSTFSDIADQASNRYSSENSQLIREKAELIITRLRALEHPVTQDRMLKEIPKAMEGLLNRIDKAPERREIIKNKLERLDELQNEGIFLSTLWDIGWRANYAGTRDFYGNCPPQVIEQCLLRLTKEDDLIVDPMAGSGTAIEVSNLLGRKCIAYDIKPPNWRNDIIRNDSQKIPLEESSVDLVFLHPPYWDMVRYTKSEEKLPDLSRAKTLEQYLCMLRETIKESYRVLKAGKFLCILLGDRVKNGRFIPLCRKAANLAEEAGFEDSGYAVKITQGATSLRKRGKIIFAEVAYTENLKIEHDLIMFFRKPGKLDD